MGRLGDNHESATFYQGSQVLTGEDAPWNSSALGSGSLYSSLKDIHIS